MMGARKSFAYLDDHRLRPDGQTLLFVHVLPVLGTVSIDRRSGGEH